MKKETKLRGYLRGMIALSMLALWAVTMLALTFLSAQKVEIEASVLMSHMQDQAGWRVQYGDNPSTRYMEQDLAYGLSVAADMLRSVGGAAALRLYAGDGTEEARSQIVSGYGYTQGLEQGEFYRLWLDDALDDAGQLTLARWIQDSRRLPAEAREETWAEVAGTAEGHVFRVRRMVVHRGEEQWLLADGPAEGETVTLAYLVLDSQLCPGEYLDMGGDDPVPRRTTMEMRIRLRDIRRAEELLDTLLERVQPDPARVFSTGSAGWGQEASVGPTRDGALVGMGCSYSKWAEGARRLGWAYVLTLAAALLLTRWLSRMLSGMVARPVEALCADVEAGRPCETAGEIAELNALSSAFNAAQEKLADELRRERDFSRAAAHELKTPLAVLRSHAEGLAEDIAPDRRGEYLEIIMDEADRMDALVRELLELSRLEAGAAPPARETVALGELVRQAFARLERPMAEKGITLEADLEELTVPGERAGLERVASNLASNALRHCAPGGSIRVALERTGDGFVRLTVDNDGANIPEQALPRLWEAFYRGDAGRSREDGGAGLGLAIVRGVLARHGGRWGAENRPGGVRFRAEVPLE